MLSHNVYFTLHDASETAIQELVAACHQYLKNHTGVIFFSAGTLVKDLARPVNDHAFEVALNVVFDSREAHDAYQTVPDHLKFIAENKANWKQVRVFDSNC